MKIVSSARASMDLMLQLCVLIATASTVCTQKQMLRHTRSSGSPGQPILRPVFLDSPQQLSVPVGSDVSFPCAVDRQVESYKMIFKYVSANGEDRIIFAGFTKVAHFPRIKKKGSSFILSHVLKTDSGEYVCRFETDPLTQISHKLEVLYPPKVFRESSEVQTVHQGSSVTLQCSADGNPPPIITWIRQGGLLPSGTPSEEGYSMTLEDVNRHIEGTYECSASNGIGISATETMTVQVEYPPEIISEQSIIHTGEGNDAKLVCMVHGRPSPGVTWLRRNALVDSSRHVMTHDGVIRHTLTIQNVTEHDFGEYTCKARNAMGSVENKMGLTGLAKRPMIANNPAGNETKSFLLLIITETSSPLVQYRLKYRKAKKEAGQSLPERWKKMEFFPSNQNMSLIRQGVFQIRHNITHLRPATTYDVLVEVENKFGWSLPSRLFQFFTKKEMPPTTTVSSMPQSFNHYPKVEEVAVGEPSNKGIVHIGCLLMLTTCQSVIHIFV